MAVELSAIDELQSKCQVYTGLHMAIMGTETGDGYLQVDPARLQNLSRLGQTLECNVVLHAQLLNEALTLRAVPLILPLVTIHKQLVVCKQHDIL